MTASQLSRIAGVMTVMLALCSVHLSAKPLPGGKGKPAGNRPDYFPLAVGNKWHLQMDVGGQMLNVVSVIAKSETIDGKALARLEVAIDGKGTDVSEHLSTSDKGVFRHRYNGLEIDPPLCLLKYPIKEGESWENKVRIGGQQLPFACSVGKWEQIEVPAGKFKAIRVHVATMENGKNIDSDYWFAAGVGVVRQEVDYAGLKISMKLEKFTPAKKK